MAQLLHRLETNHPIFYSQMEWALLDYRMSRRWLRAHEKNEKAIAFCPRHGFRVTEERKLEEGTTEYLARMER